MYRFTRVFAACSFSLLACGLAAYANQTPSSKNTTSGVIDAKIESARLHFQKGRIEEAAEIYEQLHKAATADPRVPLGLSQVLQVQGKWAEATQTIEKAVEDLPQDARLRARLAELHFLQGRYALAAKAGSRAIQLDGDQALARLVLADVYWATGRIKEADNAYRWFVRFYNRVQPEDADTLLLVGTGAIQYARLHSVSGIFNFAVNTLCPDALQNDASSWQAHHLAGVLLLEKFNRAQAIPEFQQALAINPRAAAVLVSLADASLQQRKLKQAEKFLTRALDITPDLPAALTLSADLKLLNGDTYRALELLSRALAINPHDQQTLARVAACYLLEDGLIPSERFERLMTHLDAIDELQLESSERFTKLVVALAKRNPHPGPFLTAVGKTLESRRKFELAERFFLQATRSIPQLPEPQAALGMLYMQIGKTDKARKVLDQAFKTDPFHVRVSNMRKVLKLLESYKPITTDHFVIHVDSQADALLGKYLAEYLEEQYDGLVGLFGFEPAQRTQFEIYHNAKGLSAHQWFSARMVGLPWIQTIGASTGMIVAMASPTAADEPYNWARVVKHEFVHIITLQQTHFNIPHWFTEALAVTSEGFPRPHIWNKLLLERVPKGQLRDLGNLNQGFIRPESPLDWQFAYCQSRLYAQYIIDNYGKESISKLLQAYRDNLNTDQAIRQVFKIDRREFEKGHRVFLSQIVAKLQGGQAKPQRPLSELEKAYLANKDSSQTAAEYAHGLLKARRRKQARDLASTAIESNPQEPLAAVVMAELELRAEDLPAAAQYLVQALDQKNPNRHVLALLARVRLQQEDYSQAAQLYELGSNRYPNQAQWLRGSAAAYSKLGNEHKLKSTLQELARLDADNVEIRKKLAEMELANDNFTAGLAHSKSALYIDVLDPDIHHLLFEAYFGLRQYTKAIEECQVLLQLKPDNVDVMYQLATALIESGDKTTARARLQDLLAKHPNHSKAKQLLQRLR